MNGYKRIALLIAAALLAMLLPAAFGEGEPSGAAESGFCGDDVAYVLDADGTLTVSGAGEWYAWAFENDERITRVVLESGVTEVGYAAFYWTENVAEVVIPDTVESIGYEAIYACHALEHIAIPASVVYIAPEAFNGCDSLSRVDFGGTMAAWKAMVNGKYFQHYRLMDCTVVCADGTLEPGTWAEQRPTHGLLPGGEWDLDADGVMTISGPVRLNGFPFPYEFTQYLTKVAYGPEVAEIEPGMFSYSYRLTAFEVDPANPNYASFDGVLFDKDMTRLIEAPTAKTGSFTVPAGVRVICYDAFIGSYLTAVSLPDSLETIEYQAFWNNSITSLDLPASLREIEGDSLGANIAEISVAAGNQYYTVVDGALLTKSLAPRLVCAAVGDAESWSVPNGVVEIGRCAFIHRDLHEVRLPASLQRIELGAFAQCNQLENVVFDGTRAEWANVEIGEDNGALPYSTVRCSDGDIAPQPITGACGDDVTYVLEPAEGLLTVTGAGAWEAFAFEGISRVVRVVLEPGVTEIGEAAFRNCGNLVEIDIPDTVTAIKSYAFYGTGITGITIPATVTEIGQEAFGDCEQLREITYGGTMDEWYAMADMGELWRCTVICADGTIEPTAEPPEEENDDYTYTVEDGVLYINGTGMQSYHFYGDSEAMAATRVVIGPEMAAIDVHFTDLQDLTAIEVDPDNARYASVDGVLYDKDVTLLIECPIAKAGVLTVPEGVVEIGESALLGSDLDGIVLPNSLETISRNAFTQIHSITEITIPANVSSIDYSSFDVAYSLTAFRVAEGNPDYYAVDGVLFDRHNDALFRFPTGRGGDYTAPAVSTIGYRAFYGCGIAGAVVLPEGVTYIAADAFRSTVFNSISLPSTLRGIGSGAFFDNNLEEISYAGAVAQWAEVVVDQNNADLLFKTIHCADGDTTADETTGSCGDEASYLLTRDGELTISGSGAIRAFSFFSNQRLRSVTIGSGVQSIDVQAFMSCENLETLVLPASLQEIEYGAFDRCEQLSDVYFLGTEAQWRRVWIDEGNEPLLNATPHFEGGEPQPVQELLLPGDLVEIEDGAFIGSGVENVYVPYGCQRIGADAFKNCAKLAMIDIPGTVIEIGEGAFDGCPNVKIYTGYGTAAAAYAEQHGIPYEEVGE